MLLCRADTVFETEEDGLSYSRLPAVRCTSERMPVRRGQTYTAISFLGPPGEGLTFYDEPEVNPPARDALPDAHPISSHLIASHLIPGPARALLDA
jgi:hypothetical protein